jgi:TBC domain-containing protein kinase-like protein
MKSMNFAKRVCEVKDENLNDFIQTCLIESEAESFGSRYLLNHPFFELQELPILWFKRPFVDKVIRSPQSHSLLELLYYWRLNGGDFEKICAISGNMSSTILSFPMVLTPNTDIETIVSSQNRNICYSDDPYVIPLEKLSETLNALHMNVENAKILRKKYQDEWKIEIRWTSTNISRIIKNGNLQRKLKLLEKESDFEYQYYRNVLFSKLLDKYPHSLEAISKEARRDIPPVQSI